MRKVLSFVLVLSLVLGSFSFAFSATPVPIPSDVKGTEFETPVNVLANLEVTTGYPDGTFKPEGAVTRAEMAAFIVRELGLTSSADYMNSSSFSDMAGHWADKYVAVIAGKGVVTGYPDGTFRPDEKVSFPEAITMIVRSLGYIDGCESLVGNWPINYVSLASDLDITDNVKVVLSGSADRGAVALMLYNALTVANVSVNNDGEVTKKGTEDDPITFLSKLDCYLDDGEDSDGVHITPDLISDEDKTLIDLSNYAFAYCDVYRLDDGDDDPIIAIDEVRSDVLKGTIDIDTKPGDGYDTTTIKLASGKEYDIPDLDVDANPVKDIMVFLNGEEVEYKYIRGGATASQNNDLLDCWPLTIYGELDGDEMVTVHGIVAGAVTSAWLVDEDDLKDIEDAIEDGNGTVMDIELPSVDDDEEELDLEDIAVIGDAKSLEEIEENDVVFIYSSGNKVEPDKVTFEVSRGTKEITVKEAHTKQYGDTIYDTDGNEYKFSANMVNFGTYWSYTNAQDKLGFKYEEVYSDNFTPGDSYKLFIDPWGYVYGMEEIDSTPDSYGIVIDIASSSDLKDAQIRLFTNDGDTITFDADEDDISNEDILKDKQWKQDKVTYGAIVKYSLNSAGDIDELEVLEMEASQIDDYSIKSEKWYSESIDSACVFFDIQSDGDFGSADQKDSKWDNLSGLKDDVEYTAKYYYEDGDASTDNIVVMLISNKSASDHEYFAVNEVTSIKENDDNKYKIKGFYNGDEATRVTKDQDVEFNYESFVYVITSSGVEVSDADVLRTGSAILGDSNNGGYGVVSDIDKYSLEGTDFADDVVVYIQEYKDGVPDEIVVGEARDIDEDDFVIYLYDDDDDIELVFLVDKDDIDNYKAYLASNGLID